MKMTVTTTQLKFYPNSNINKLTIHLPYGAEILSVQSTNDQCTLSIIFMVSNEMFNTDLWREYNFIICKCDYTDVDVTDYKYIGTVNGDNCPLVVFGKSGLIV